MSRLSFCICALLVVAFEVNAAVIFESATKGPTQTSTIGHYSLDSQAMGVRFQLAQPVTVQKIGAHVLRDYWAWPTSVPVSIVALSGPSDFPDSTDRSTLDFVVTAFLAAGEPSNDVVADVAPTVLNPGWYALVAGRYSGSGSNAVMPSTDIPTGSYTYFSGSPSDAWWHANSNEPKRMFIVGLVPEPTGALGIAMVAGLLARRKRRG